jgi:hypothetical protein
LQPGSSDESTSFGRWSRSSSLRSVGGSRAYRTKHASGVRLATSSGYCNLFDTGRLFRVLDVVPFEQGDESPFVGLLKVEAAQRADQRQRKRQIPARPRARPTNLFFARRVNRVRVPHRPAGRRMRVAGSEAVGQGKGS